MNLAGLILTKIGKKQFSSTNSVGEIVTRRTQFNDWFYSAIQRALFYRVMSKQAFVIVWRNELNSLGEFYNFVDYNPYCVFV